jgi:hypothetical protein
MVQSVSRRGYHLDQCFCRILPTLNSSQTRDLDGYPFWYNFAPSVHKHVTIHWFTSLWRILHHTPRHRMLPAVYRLIWNQTLMNAGFTTRISSLGTLLRSYFVCSVLVLSNVNHLLGFSFLLYRLSNLVAVTIHRLKNLYNIKCLCYCFLLLLVA